MANIILSKSLHFAQATISAYLALRAKGHYKLADQFVGAGTSIGANVEEAQAAHSKLDFIAKLTIAHKEAREAKYWLRVLDREELLGDFQEMPRLKREIEEIISLLHSIIKRSRENLK
ncbi:four helix bundle protein [Algoriphagus halophytocola]|uniref:Four helix bundle protein n=1 Tax=Algoriphagus halophytocola TaxID=2991499 RepID=A0ABY6MMP6_9BACT|nr:MULTISPECIES: four helix bundle protein [unclassified Algoriphagus]UZD23956.1 four helix bundle protein [Algoriphagus sp. TR-M5]WBL41327.1 four helix bundle protein [Algoriphagus sp. TR-M9]